MANIAFNRVQSRMKELKHLNAEVAIGASGAPTMDTTKTNGVASIARISEGAYTVTLTDKYAQLVDCTITLVDDSLALTRFQLTGETVATTKTISFVCVGATDTDNTAPKAKEVAQGAKLLINIWVKNTSAR